MRVYIVEEFFYYSHVVGVFDSYEKANAYIESILSKRFEEQSKFSNGMKYKKSFIKKYKTCFSISEEEVQ